jgi:hypothetical protein
MFIEYSMGVRHKLKNRITDETKLNIVVPVKDPGVAAMSCSMWKDAFKDGFPEWNSKHGKVTPEKFVFTLLGSKTNSKHMINTESKINAIKAMVSGSGSLAPARLVFLPSNLSLARFGILMSRWQPRHGTKNMLAQPRILPSTPLRNSR